MDHQFFHRLFILKETVNQTMIFIVFLTLVDKRIEFLNQLNYLLNHIYHIIFLIIQNNLFYFDKFSMNFKKKSFNYKFQINNGDKFNHNHYHLTH